MRIDSINFKAGPTPGSNPLLFRPGTVTVLIGPNNGGKSKALSELQETISPTGYTEPVVIGSASYVVSNGEIESKISSLTVPKRPGEDPNPDVVSFEGKGGRHQVNLPYLRSSLRPGADHDRRQYAAQHVLRHFYINLSGSDRLDLSKSAPSQQLGEPANSTIAALFQDDPLRERLSVIVQKAFNQYLVIDPTGMANLVFRLSNEMPETGIEKSLSQRAVDYFSAATSLQLTSDGTKAFIGILAEVLAGNPDIIFVDEPEAFLHPSLAYALGSEICRNLTNEKQLFAATHSSHFLLGCLLSGASVNIIRLTHRNDVATARHLSAERLRSLMIDPLFRSVGAVNALFYEAAVILEGDSDRAFYDEVNDRMNRINANGISHAAFLNAHNKQTAPNIVLPLREIGIPAAFILDLDWLKEDGQVWSRYFAALGAPIGLKESFGAARRHVRARLEAADPEYKRKGGVAVLSGDDREAADAFLDQMEEYGLFTVRTGELESWLANEDLDRTKSKWLVSAFS